MVALPTPDTNTGLEWRIQMTKDNPEKSRVPYEPPRLIVYGDIRLITEANAQMTRNDNPQMPTHLS